MKQTPKNNLYLWWRDRSPQERAAYQKGLSAVEVTHLLKQIQADRRKCLDELEGSQQAQSKGHAKAPPRMEKSKLHKEWEKLSPEQRAALEAEFDPMLERQVR